MNQSRMMAALFHDLFYPALFAEVVFFDELDLHVIFFGNALSVIPDLVAQRFGKTRIIKYTKMAIELTQHNKLPWS
jgi:hypothetical protein